LRADRLNFCMGGLALNFASSEWFGDPMRSTKSRYLVRNWFRLSEWWSNATPRSITSRRAREHCCLSNRKRHHSWRRWQVFMMVLARQLMRCIASLPNLGVRRETEIAPLVLAMMACQRLEVCTRGHQFVKLTCDMITTTDFHTVKSAFWVGAFLCHLLQMLFGCGFLLHSFLPRSIVLLASLTGMVRQLVREACLELASSACHDWLIVSTTVNLTRAAVRPETHSKVWHMLKSGHDTLHIVSGRFVRETIYGVDFMSCLSNACGETACLTEAKSSSSGHSGHLI